MRYVLFFLISNPLILKQFVVLVMKARKAKKEVQQENVVLKQRIASLESQLPQQNQNDSNFSEDSLNEKLELKKRIKDLKNARNVDNETIFGLKNSINALNTQINNLKQRLKVQYFYLEMSTH